MTTPALRRSLRPFCTVAILLFALTGATPAGASERLCDTSFEDCRTPLLDLIRRETVGLDVAFWFMEDSRYSTEIIKRHQAGVAVRVLVDPRANAFYPINGTLLANLRDAGIPMRRKAGGGILHWKMMLFAGQATVEFSGANYSANAFGPIGDPYVNYIDESIYFSDDPSVVNTMRTRFDDLWTGTAYLDYANIAGPLTRRYTTSALDPEMNFPPGEDYASRSVKRYAAETAGIDVIMYRITDRRHTDAMIAAVQRGVPVRLITEPKQYREPTRLWHSWNVDRLHMAGVHVRQRAHEGLNHQKTVMLRGQALTIFGSSNWTSPSANSQEEHNYFTKKAWFFSWFAAQFDRKWRNATGHAETEPFAPLPPDKPTLVFPSVASTTPGANAALIWKGGPWAHLYDVYFGTAPTPPLVASNLALGPTELSSDVQQYALPPLVDGVTYYWRIVSRTVAQKEATPATTWSFRVGACATGAGPTIVPLPASGGTGVIAISAPADCDWRVSTAAPWVALSPSRGSGSGNAGYAVGANPGPARAATLMAGGRELTIVQAEGTAPAPSPTPAPEPDPDPGLSEDPVPSTSAPTPLRYYLAEGATGPFFHLDILLANPTERSAPVRLRFMKDDGTTIEQRLTVPAWSRATVRANDVAGLATGAVSTLVESTEGVPLVVERTMFWDAAHYGGHGAGAVDGPAARWYFAEGSQNGLDTYVLLANPGVAPATATVTFLMESGAPVIRTCTIAPTSRFTLYAGAVPELRGRSFSIEVSADAPVIAERAMYFGAARFWDGGHASAGVTAPATRWFHAEGATGGFFETYILVGNPDTAVATVRLTFLTDTGTTVVRQRSVPARGRLTVNIEAESPALANTAVSTVVESDRPVISERTMYWPRGYPAWAEAHNSFGLTTTASAWGLAEGRTGGSEAFETYILIANPSTTAAEIKVTFLGADGIAATAFYRVAPTSRFNLHVNSMVPELRAASFGAIVESLNGVGVAVERALYWTGGGRVWGGGTNATAMPLR